jgi:hypothetical protein
MSVPTDPTDGPGFDPTELCLTPACVNAKSKLESARTAFVKACNAWRSVQSVRTQIQRILVVPMWVLVVLVVVAIILWFLGLGFLSVILWALVLIYGIVVVISLVVVRIEGTLAADLNDAADAAAAAVGDVVAQCLPQCVGDLSVPECNPA